MRKLGFMVVIMVLVVAALPTQAQDGDDQATDGSLILLPELFTRAVETTDAGNYDQAVVDYSLFLLLNPTFSQAYFNRALNYDALDNKPQAMQDMSRALAYKSPSAEYTAMVYFNRARLYLEQNDLEAGLNDLDASIEAFPASVDSLMLRVQVLLFQQRYDDALSDYDALISLEPDSTSHHMERAIVHLQLGDMEAALADYSQAIALDPTDALIHADRARFYGATRNYENALADINNAIGLDPENSNFYLMRGSINAETDHLTAAAADYLHWMVLNQTQVLTVDHTLTSNQRFTLEMGPGIVYVIPLIASAGQSVSIAVDSQAQTPIDPLLVILDIDGAPLVADDDSGDDMNAAITSYMLPDDGEYTVVIGQAGGGGDDEGDIMVTVALSAAG